LGPFLFGKEQEQKKMGKQQQQQVVTLALNGERVEIESPDPSITLLSYLRTHTRFTGTKLSCSEGLYL
jgi:xanthine dehydrogenase iron-sulfur cluster and FAD-binding subunit A